MNPNIPDDRQDIEYDPTLIGDEIFEVACQTFNTEAPTDDQLEDVRSELTDSWEAYEAEE